MFHCEQHNVAWLSRATLNRSAAHWHGEGDLFAVSKRAAIDGDVINLLSGCWSTQAWGLEDPVKWKISVRMAWQTE
jgi:hypothetical protein